MWTAFVVVNCAALSEELIASDLFGHEKGAFTGAHQRKSGKLELAHGGDKRAAAQALGLGLSTVYAKMKK